MKTNFDTRNLRLDPHKEAMFKEFVNFKLNRDKKFRFSEFHKMCGISRKQWDVFRVENKDKKVEWVLD